jgi:hypothetical protein
MRFTHRRDKWWEEGGIDKPLAVVREEDFERSHPNPTAIDKSTVIGHRHWGFRG